MPSTLSGILILLFSFAPGYVYLLLAERQGAPLRTVSAFRETAQVILTSFLALSAATAALVLTTVVLGDRAPDVRSFATDPGAYWEGHVFEVMAWGAGLLLFACALSYLWGAHRVGTLLADVAQSSPIGRFIWPSSTTSFTSAWTLLLQVHHPEMHKYVRARLSDGCLVEGWLSSFNPHVSETGDRELSLANPVFITSPDGTVTENEGGAVALSARAIVLLDVEYHASRELGSDPSSAQT